MRRIVLIMVFVYSSASSATEFNTDVLDVEDRNTVDLARFVSPNYMMPGHYFMSINVNDTLYPEQAINFYPSESDANVTEACLPFSVVQTLGIKTSVLKELTFWKSGQCANLATINGLTSRSDMSSATIYLNIPQAWLTHVDANWTPISSWDVGTNGAMLDYNANTSISRDSTGFQSRQTSGNGTAGFNLGAWRLRGDFQGSHYSSAFGSSQQFTWSSLYAYRPIPEWGAKLTLGESYMNSNVFDSFRYSGIDLSSDDQMVPPNLRGYAPEITGVARSNAHITVRQGQRVLYETTVPSGPFRIQDLNGAVSGALDVEIVEAGGETQRYQVQTANVPYLSRPGRIRYKASVGRPIFYDHATAGPVFTMGEASWGINNKWSLYGGTLQTQGYSANALGVGRNLFSFGVISADLTHSAAQIPGVSTATGNSLRLNYAKRFDSIDAEISFAGYRFSEEKFMTMDQYIDARQNFGWRSNSKSMYTVLASKAFLDSGISGNLSFIHQDYWNKKSSESLNIFLSRYMRTGWLAGGSTSLALSRSQYDLQNDTSLSLSLTVPFGEKSRLGFDVYTSGGKSRQRATFSQYSKASSYQISASQDAQGAGSDAYYSYRGQAGEVNVNASYQGNGDSNLGVSVQGGITATAAGVAAHGAAYNGGTRLMIDTDGVSGVSLQNGEERSNLLGVAVIPAVNSYYKTDVRVDIDNLPDDVEAKTSVVQATLTEGAIGYRKLLMSQGAKSMVIISLPDGSHPPFGTTVTDRDGREVAMIDDKGFTYLTGIRPSESFYAQWGQSKKCQITMPERFTPTPQQRILCVPITI